MAQSIAFFAPLIRCRRYVTVPLFRCRCRAPMRRSQTSAAFLPASFPSRACDRARKAIVSQAATGSSAWRVIPNVAVPACRSVCRCLRGLGRTTLCSRLWQQSRPKPESGQIIPVDRHRFESRNRIARRRPARASGPVAKVEWSKGATALGYDCVIVRNRNGPNRTPDNFNVWPSAPLTKYTL
jgi:hypothetical protein